jgi:hypothetical protein
MQRTFRAKGTLETFPGPIGLNRPSTLLKTGEFIKYNDFILELFFKFENKCFEICDRVTVEKKTN